MTWGQEVHRHGVALGRRYKLDPAEQRAVLWSLAGKTPAEIADGLGGIHCAPWLIEVTLERALGKLGARGGVLFAAWCERLRREKDFFVRCEAARIGNA